MRRMSRKFEKDDLIIDSEFPKGIGLVGDAAI